MEETKHKIKIKRHSRRNWHAAAACLLSIALLVCLSAQYLSFVSKTIYAESTEHLEELLHKSNNMLSMIVKKNTSYLHVWNGFLSSDPDDASTQAYLESAQQQLGFAEFYFLSYDGNYMTPSGKTGYLGLQSNLDELLSDQKDVVLNAALPGQDPMLVFICPETKGIYRGFAYDAIAIGHYNNVVMKAVDDSAFGGTASSFVIYPDGQVVIENISEGSESIYNFIAILQEYSDLTEAQIQELTDDFAQGITGNRKILYGLRKHRHPELDPGGACPAGFRQCRHEPALAAHDADRSPRCPVDCGNDPSDGHAPGPHQAAPPEHRDFVPGCAVREAVPERGRRFPDVGRRDLQGGLCQPEH